MNPTNKKPNSLINANSPYLLQHAYNPVEWNEWNEEVLTQAMAEQKLLIVSIGYAACHWCHVMEKECFEDEETAKLMNAHFMNIKVDREERPDIDQVYMDAIQLLTGQGGWPLNAICLPNGKPLYVGTYFPKNNWQTLLKKVHEFYTHETEEAYAYANKISTGLQYMEIFEPEHGVYINSEVVRQQVENLKSQTDAVYGGFKWVPKFLLPVNWDLFLHHGKVFNDAESIAIVKLTCNHIINGGIHDILAGGFSRYSTDAQWLVPHFEKMLYDNAQLISLFSKLYALDKNSIYKTSIEKTIEFLNHELKAENNLFQAALDADTLGEEGLFYVWQASEIKHWLPNDWPFAFDAFGITEEGNWEHGKNILHGAQSNEALSLKYGMPLEQIALHKQKLIDLLLQKRNERKAPSIDNKKICAWNALLIIGLADAAKALNSETYRTQCKEFMDACIEHFYQKNELYRIVNTNQKIEGFAEDYALFCEALLATAEACHEQAYILLAKEIMEHSIASFYVSEEQLFQFTKRNQSALIKTKFEIQDSVIPSSNAIFTKCLFYLSYYFDEENFDTICEDLILKMIPRIKEQGNHYSKWMQVILLKTEGFKQVIATGENALEGIQKLQQNYEPNTLYFCLQQASEIPLFQGKAIGKELNIYVCKNKTCGLPIQEFDRINEA